MPGIIIMFFPAIVSFCMSGSHDIAENYFAGYNLDTPSEKYSLPAELFEISGVVYRQGKIFCNQDESADIFVFDPIQKKIMTRYSFGIKGDFEDLAVIGTDAYVLKSNGTIVRVNGFAGNNTSILEYHTPLSSRNNAEGLAFEASSNSLLIACKGTRDIYRFSLARKALNPDPCFSLDLENPENYLSKEIFEKYNLLKNKKPGISEFNPSALAFHPSGDLYIISSTGRLLLVLDQNFKIKGFSYLSAGFFTQPEGITFSENGDMYISNEGRKGPGYIVMFRE